MSAENFGQEYEFEPQYGLPERLPFDEHIIWQGSPDTGALARSAFHVRKLVMYFGLLALACAWPALESDAGIAAVLQSVKWITPLAVIALASVWVLAWMTARTTVYTLTNKRIVMRLGIVLTVSFNLPLKRIAAADIRTLDAGFGDITLALHGDDRIAWVHLWPSVRPWRINKPEPSFRAIANVQTVSAQLRDAWSQATGLQAHAATPPVPAHSQNPSLQVSPV
jgi:hypothetical protein